MRHILLALPCALFLISGCAGSPAARAQAPNVGHPAISEADAALIRAYYRDQRSGPGARAGRGGGAGGGLPPGIARNLERGKPLPPGIARQVLPEDLLARIRPLPSGYQYLVVAGRLVLIETATLIVRDVLTDILFN